MTEFASSSSNFESRERRKRTLRRVIAAMSLFALAACGSQQKEWGNYNPDLPELMTRQGTPAQTWLEKNPTDDAELGQIADQSTGLWLHGDGSSVFDSLESNIEQSLREQKTPVIVLYNIPGRDCGNYSDGGAESLADYKAWIDRIHTIIGETGSIIVVEPDALLLADSEQCKTLFAEQPEAREQRIEALNYAIQKLNTPKTNLYIDAGHPGWSNPGHVADLLKEVGVELADGISLNVANHYSTDENLARANEISDALEHPLRIVVDTSRNGTTDVPYDGNWCNESDRALGDNPTILRPSDDDVMLDAKLWVKYPGKSDGLCNEGLDAGLWDVEAARELVRNRTS